LRGLSARSEHRRRRALELHELRRTRHLPERSGRAAHASSELECDLGFGLGRLSCWQFDGILNTSLYRASRPSFYRFGFGTSFAAPHGMGVAALIIGKHGGAMSPGQVQAILRRSADDLGPAGRDAFHGWGRVNAERAIEMTRE
jgi:subtilisin family serine protease